MLNVTYSGNYFKDRFKEIILEVVRLIRSEIVIISNAMLSKMSIVVTPFPQHHYLLKIVTPQISPSSAPRLS